MQIITYNFKTHKNTGFSLIELMLSIAIGSFLIIGAAYAFQEAQKTYRVNDNIARLQEQAQFVLDTLEEDVRMSNFWGLHNITAAVVKDGSIATLGVIGGDCEGNWALDLSLGIYGTNNVNPALVDDTTTRDWGRGIGGIGCITPASKYQDGTDSLVVKHAGNNIVLPDALDTGKIYVTSNETPQSILFRSTSVPSTAPSAAGLFNKIFELRSHGYYVRNYSFEDASGNALDEIPMLRRITLVDGGSVPKVQDREISAGVQDFQVEFGIDTSTVTSPERGSVNRYVSPDSGILDKDHADHNPEAQILSVRVWILMQALNEELNFNNTATYSYAGTDTTVDDGYRRLLVNRTFQVRNMQRTGI